MIKKSFEVSSKPKRTPPSGSQTLPKHLQQRLLPKSVLCYTMLLYERGRKPEAEIRDIESDVLHGVLYPEAHNKGFKKKSRNTHLG